MELGSVKSLKMELTETVARSVEKNIEKFGVEVTTNRRASPTTRTLALGIADGRSKNDFRLAVRLQRRSLEEDGELIERLAEAANGEIDVRYVGHIFKQSVPWHQERQRPLLVGCSVAHYQITAGTLGGFARSQKTGRIVILSNNHVLANEDAATIGDAILQPSPYDGGVNTDRVGALADFVKLKSQANLVDAAICSVAEDIDVVTDHMNGIGRLAGLRADQVLPGERVAKVGRTTGVTHGVVTAIEVDDIGVRYDRGVLSFDRQIEIEGEGDSAFSAGGDSGSIIVDSENRAFGLLFAGGDVGGSNGKGLTYANELRFVLDQLNIAFPA